MSEHIQAIVQPHMNVYAEQMNRKGSELIFLGADLTMPKLEKAIETKGGGRTEPTVHIYMLHNVEYYFMFKDGK